VKILKSLLLFFSLLPISSFAALELNFDFGYDRQIYGVNRQNSTVSRNYSAGISTYLFNLTAIDFNYSNNQEITTQNDRYHINGTDYDLISQQNRVSTNVYGVGIKQMLAGRGSRLIPVISAGYAREFVVSTGEITYENTISHNRLIGSYTPEKQRYNSIFGSFTLQLRLTDQFSLKGTVRTLFPAFDYNKAKDNLKYLVGFSWIF
jgi:hypothetical protein